MDRRTFTAGILATAITATMPAQAFTQPSEVTHVEETWDTTTLNRIVRLTVGFDAFPSEEAAAEAFSARRSDVKDGTLYEEEIKTFGDESFIVHYQYPYMSSFAANARTGSLLIRRSDQVIHLR